MVLLDRDNGNSSKLLSFTCIVCCCCKVIIVLVLVVISNPSPPYLKCNVHVTTLGQSCFWWLRVAVLVFPLIQMISAVATASREVRTSKKFGNLLEVGQLIIILLTNSIYMYMYQCRSFICYMYRGLRVQSTCICTTKERDTLCS